MEMAEIPKLDLSSSCSQDLISEEKNRGSAILSSDHINAFQYSAEKSDSFVIDMDAFSSANHKDPTNANSKITRSLSRKGSLRLGDRKVNSSATLYEKDTICSPKGTLVGPCTLEKTAGMSLGSMDHSINPLVYQQITMTTNNIIGNPTENKCSITRRNSFRRPSSWALDPKRVLLFFATLSSMGTMLLIYFILSSSKQSADEYGG
ncbi:uncharacterized protein LOC114173056 isoform X2 [Vigna unguiculata]|uniref:uncharacterized protein LOC114173056 isoform X2 n=1 Tax=Vigna unguiculata TaxID=3917 RepID=UPI00101606ED|nr:uncharacterized protein LOC114173056 isoform X2 [Vigna unguiculata]